jgi:hypothetical protein
MTEGQETTGTGTQTATEQTTGAQPASTEQGTETGTKTVLDGGPVPPEILNFISDKYELKGDWKNKFVPEELRTLPIYNEIKDLPGAFSVLGNQAKLVGKKGLILPSEGADEKEWGPVWDNLGRPKTKDDYNMDVPEEHKDYFSDELIAEGRELFYNIGLSSKQANALWEFEKARAAAIDKMATELEEQEYEQMEKALKEDWGIAYNENMHIANRIISENSAPGEERDKLLADYGNDPKFAKFLVNIGKKFIGHKIITDVETPSTNLEKKKAELMKHPAYNDAGHPEHKKIVQEVNDIFAALARMRDEKATATTVS